MGRSKLMKKIKRKITPSPTIKFLSNDLLKEILARVASSSITDIFNVKLTCKEFSDFGDDEEILRRVSLEKIPLIPWHPPSSHQLTFLRRCEESRNPEILYRRGLVEYFNGERSQLGMEFLKRAADLGHVEASYTLGMILLCSNNEERIRGVEFLKMVEMSKTRNMGILKKSRKSLGRAIGYMWNKTFLQQEITLCSDLTCNKNQRKKSGWESDEDEDFSCRNCKWDHEVLKFCKMLRGQY